MPIKNRTSTWRGRGFIGERIIELPKNIGAKCEALPLIRNLYISRMGFYPKAKYHYYQRPAGFSQALLIYCVDGEGWVQLGEGKYKIASGSAIFIPANTPHAYAADSTHPWTIYWFHLKGKQCNEVAALLMGDDKATQPISVPFSSERIALFDRIFDSFSQGYGIANMLFANLALQFFLASFAAPHRFDRPEKQEAHNSMQKAVHFMQEHLHEPVTLDNIALAAGLSVSFFCRKFKQETGYTPIEYCNHLRMQKACHLLHFTNLRTNEIALRVGIGDPFYFSRLFKKQLGMSPSNYRKQETQSFRQSRAD